MFRQMFGIFTLAVIKCVKQVAERPKRAMMIAKIICIFWQR